MKRKINIILISALSIGMLAVLSGCGLTDSLNSLSDGLSGMFSEEDQDLLNSIADGSSAEEIEALINGETSQASSINGIQISFLGDMSEDVPDELISEGERIAWEDSETTDTWTEKWYTGDNTNGPYKTLESVDFIGYYYFINSDTNTNSRLYMVYQITALQAGSLTGETADYIADCQSEFSYYWYIRFDSTSEDEGATFTYDSSHYIECSNKIEFTTYTLGGFDIVNIITKDYYGFNTIENLYDSIVNLNNNNYVLSGSMI